MKMGQGEDKLDVLWKRCCSAKLLPASPTLIFVHSGVKQPKQERVTGEYTAGLLISIPWAEKC